MGHEFNTEYECDHRAFIVSFTAFLITYSMTVFLAQN